MAWTRQTLVGDAVPVAIWHGDGRWLVSTSSNIQVTADFATYAVTTPPNPGSGSLFPSDAVSDGVRWYVVNANSGWMRSTDGLTGTTWQTPSNQIISTTRNAPGASAIGVTATGRLIALAGKWICTSDDGGDTWNERGTVVNDYPSSSDDKYARVRQFEDGTIVLTSGESVFRVSTDNGVTWSVVNPGVAEVIASVAKIAAGYCVTYDNGYALSRVSTDNGATWANYGLIGRCRVDAYNGQIWIIGGDWYAPVVRRTPDLVSWTDIDVSDLVAEALMDFGVGSGTLAATLMYDTYGVYTTPAGAPAIIPITLPIRLAVEPLIPISLPIRLAVQGAAPIALPVRLSVGTAGSAHALPLRLSVIDPALIADLDGAASWAAAPSGLWELRVQLGNDDISDRIAGPCVVTAADNAARVAEFSFLPAGTLAPMAIIGQRVRIQFAQMGGGASQPVFQGVVDVPSIDLTTGVVTCSCTDQAQEVWANTPRTTIDTLVGGRWHEAVSGEPDDNFAYLVERIQSVGASWALDVQQQPRILPWRGPARTLTVRRADVLDGSLSVDLPSRDQLRTRIVCRMQYRYTLLRYRGISAQYSQPLSFWQPVWVLGVGVVKPAKKLMLTSMVEGAAESLPGWDLQDLEIETAPNGVWNLGTELDQYLYSITASVAPTIALGFSASYSSRWQQTVTEDYTVTVVWQSLEAQMPGPLSVEIGANLEAEFDQADWGSDPSVAPHVGGAGVGDAVLPWQPAGYDAAARDEVLRTLLDRAWVRLWDASRSGRVRFALPCRPDLWLDTAILLEHERVRAAGKVIEVTHTMDMQSGEASTEVTLAVGMPGNAAAAHPAWALPAAPVDDYVPPIDAYSCEIGTFVGGESGTPAWDDETMIGFSTNYEGDLPGAEYYPHQLRIKAPDIAAEDRDPRELTASAEIAVSIPTDLLEIL